ncbi:MAG: hypothetical protein FE78DRAFT_39980 [Acidomyces sp. 'richmondensis']|nr:MAG: hypothetical protein FE78DRAFT_39980 [Acidomyces sp. 'richmondensis']
MAPGYRAPGRSTSTRTHRAHQPDHNDVFEGLPVKQWTQRPTRISLAPPSPPPTSDANNTINPEHKWSVDPPMPRDSHLLHPWTQHLLRLARSGKVGTKRKAGGVDGEETADDERGGAGGGVGGEDDGGSGEVTTAVSTTETREDRAYVARKWKPVPEALMEDEHRHFEFLAKRRRGLPSLYGPESGLTVGVVMRKTKIRAPGPPAGPDGSGTVYEALVPEGQPIEGEVTDDTIAAVAAAPGTVVEGIGVANEEGVIVVPVAGGGVGGQARRNRPPPKKKGGPGRGKKRVTFTNPDGSTYTKVVPNATKIVPQPGQTVKHVSKGEEAEADITAEQAAQRAAAAASARKSASGGGVEEEEDEESSEEGEEGEEDEREDGEVSDDEGEMEDAQTPARMLSEEVMGKKEGVVKAKGAIRGMMASVPNDRDRESGPTPRDASSSPELPLAKTHSRQSSMQTATAGAVVEESSFAAVTTSEDAPGTEDVRPTGSNSMDADVQMTEGSSMLGGKEEGGALSVEKREDEDEEKKEDLLESLEKHLEEGSGGKSKES